MSYASTPYWWQAAPLPTLPEVTLPAEVDALVVGAGYAGLAGALRLARAGRSVLVLDRQQAGEGASTRNGGITSGNIRPSLAALIGKFGEARARAIVAEGKEARDDLRRFIAAEQIDCDYQLTGRFAGVMTRAQYDQAARDAEQLATTLGVEAYAVAPGEQHRYIGTDLYRGGTVRMDVGGLHPGKFHAGLLRIAQTAGVVVRDRAAVLAIARQATGFLVQTAAGVVRAGQVLVCTNGYTDGFDAWLRRRIVPVRSRIIATATLAPEQMARLMPARMMYSDTRQLHYYYRPSPDNTRILFGGRDGTVSGESDQPTAHLHSELTRIFPELAQVGLAHSWYGYVAMHRDMIPRIFSRDGVVYATGFCGSGVVWARWLGERAAALLLGEAHAQSAVVDRSAFDFRPPKAVPFFRGTAWFMPAVFAALKRKDQRMLRERGRGHQ